jgi:hypothetical protein
LKLISILGRECYELQTIFRQAGDPTFIQILNEIRTGRLSTQVRGRREEGEPEHKVRRDLERRWEETLGWRDGGMEGGPEGGPEGQREGWREGGREGDPTFIQILNEKRTG